MAPQPVHLLARVFSNFQSRSRRGAMRRRRHRSDRINGASAYQTLEARHLLAFTGSISGGTLTLTQASDAGAIVIDNNGPGNAFRSIDADGTQVWSAATNLVVELIPYLHVPISLDLDHVHPGDIQLKLSAGNRMVNLIGSVNQVQGKLRFDGSSGAQSIELAVNHDLIVGGDMVVALGDGDNDHVSHLGHSVDVGGSWRFFGVNVYNNPGPVTVQGNLVVNSVVDNEPTTFNTESGFSVTGDLFYQGGVGRDRLFFDGNPSNVGGNVTVDLGSAGLLDNTQQAQFKFGTIGGNLTVASSNTAGNDFVHVLDAMTVNGNLNVDLGDGSNGIELYAHFSGSNIEFRGGAQTDTVSYSPTGAPANVNLVLGNGDDSVTLSKTALSPSQLRIDFGDNVTDSFDNLMGDFDFDVTLLGLKGMNAYYSASLNQWNLVQTMDLGPLTVRTMITGIVAYEYELATPLQSLSHSENLRITMLSNTGDLGIEARAPIPGFLIVNIRKGNRTIKMLSDLAGLASVGGLVKIDGANGDQSVEISGPLHASRLAVNLRGGSDQLHFIRSALLDDLVVRSVDDVHVHTLSFVQVLGNVVVNSRFFPEDTSFVASQPGDLEVFGKFTYLGGSESDQVDLKHAILGDVYIDLGDNNSGPAQLADLSLAAIGFPPSMVGNLIIHGGDSANGNVVNLGLVTMPGPKVRGVTIIDLSGNSSGSNTAVLRGFHFGSVMKYLGSNTVDNVAIPLMFTQSKLILDLSGGNDQLELSNNSFFDSLFADFGAGIDTFIDGFMGAYPFEATIVGLP